MKRDKCKTCKIYHKTLNKYACCKWYMDNVVCGNKYVKDCTEYKYKKGTEKQSCKWRIL